MPGWPRLFLFAGGMGLSAVNGIETGEGTLDFIAGVMVLASIFWPGASFHWTMPERNGSLMIEVHHRVGWPSAREIAQEGDGKLPEDNIVCRSWRLPFPMFTTCRDYSDAFAHEQARYEKRQAKRGEETGFAALARAEEEVRRKQERS